MEEAFGNDALVQMIELVASKTIRDKLRAVCEVMLAHVGSTMGLDEYGELAEPVREVMDRFQDFCRAVLTILVPTPDHMGSTVKDALNASKYKGTNPLEVMLKGALMENPWWVKSLDEVVMKAGSSKEWGPKLEDHRLELQCHARPASQSSLNDKMVALIKVFHDWPLLAENLRAGATDEVQSHAVDLIPKVIGGIIACKTIESFVVCDLESFVNGVNVFATSYFVDSDAVVDYHLRLVCWKEKMAMSIATASTDCFFDKLTEETIIRFPEVRDQVEKTAVLSEATMKKIITATPALVQIIKAKAGTR
jgi:hypothetical protein